MKVLIMGLPGSGKTTLALSLISILPEAVHLNADHLRKVYDDWDFSESGRIRQSLRMKFTSEHYSSIGTVVFADFVCPLPQTRKLYQADFIIWMDTISTGRFEDTNKVFVPPEHVDVHLTNWDDIDPKVIVDAIYKKKISQNV